MLGLETALPIVLDFVRMGSLEDKRAIAALTGAAARAFGLPGGSLTVGAVADIAVIDPERPMTLTADGISSKSKNSPFLGQQLAGRAVLTLVEGRAVHDLDGRLR
jgi:dihydroorotase